ncbi:MAG: CaiB/BaiF CoA transferase family protein [Burkholderiaceae bacterium]
MHSLLRNMRVYDASMGVAGPYCTSLLAQYGAEVIKVEPPGGDWGRHIGQSFDGLGAYFLTYNRGKKSVVLDLHDPVDLERARQLMASCDVVVESFRPGVMSRLGLDYEAARSRRENVIYLSLSGFGQQGPARHDAAMDTAMQAFTGWMHLNRDVGGTPVLMNHISIDTLTGLYAFQSLLVAWMTREKTGKGAHVDVSLMNASMAFLAPRLVEHIMSDGQLQDAVTPPTGVWRVSDGSVAISIKGQGHFEILCAALGQPQIAEDPRFGSRDLRMQNKSELYEVLAPKFLALTLVNALEILNRAKLPAARVNSFDDLVGNAQVVSTGVLKEQPQPGFGAIPVVRIPGTDGEFDPGPAPALGQDTQAIFERLAAGGKTSEG